MAKPRTPKPSKLSDEEYEALLHDLQVQLVRFQRDVIAHDEKVLLIMEGRDGAGKDGTIKRIVEHLSPRETRVAALPKPSEREKTQWYFQRFAAHLPAGGEFVIFNRSWYNRAGVEPVMGFCTEEEKEIFLDEVCAFEDMLAKSGIQIFKFYLDISRQEQAERLAARREDPLKQWKISPIDAQALEKWDAYTAARDEMLRRSDHARAPWTVVHADNKKHARLNVIRHLLAHSSYDGKDDSLLQIDKAVLKTAKAALKSDGFLTR